MKLHRHKIIHKKYKPVSEIPFFHETLAFHPSL